jgi:hypothetical protein
MSSVMMAMTTRSSTKVKARRWVDMMQPPEVNLRSPRALNRREGSVLDQQLSKWRGTSPNGVPSRRNILPYVGVAILVLFGAIGCGSKSPRLEHRSVEGLAEYLQSEGAAQRAQAAHALGEKGADAAEAVPALAKLLKDDDPRVRLEAAVALGKIGPPAKSSVPDLIAALNDKDTTLRRQAAAALGRIGPEAKAAISALEKARQDEAPIVRKAAEEALSRIREKSTKS